MGHKTITVLEARRRWQAGLLPAFDEITQMCLTIVRSAGKNGKVFASLQSYLDGGITIDGTSYRRRSILLAIHDMTEEKEAPAVFQSKILTQLRHLKVYPIPQLKLYPDIATALLRIEVVMRLSAIQAREKAERERHLAPEKVFYWQDLRQRLYSSIETASTELEGFMQTLAPAARARMMAARIASHLIGRASTANSSHAAVMSA